MARAKLGGFPPAAVAAPPPEPAKPKPKPPAAPKKVEFRGDENLEGLIRLLSVGTEDAKGKVS